MWKSQLLRYHKKLDQEALSRRIIVFFLLPILLISIFNSLFFDRYNAKLKEIRGMISEKEDLIRAKRTELNVLKDKVDKSKSDNRLIQRQNLMEEISNLENQLNHRTTSEVSPKEMALLLQEVLSKNDTVKLLSLTSMPPESVRIGQKGMINNPTSNENGALFYRHGIKIEVSGNFFEIVNYLQMIESLRWQLFWDKLEYKVTEYPNARVIFSIYSLSRQETWIGG